jgi:MtrB/PioB family decaheme-associated outer membrane protein
MIKKVYHTVLFLSLAVPVAAAEGDLTVHGAVEGGIQGVDVSGNNSAKFQEYRDLDDGFRGMLQLDVLKNSYFLQLDAKNPGRDDQAIDFNGGEYGNFNYSLYYDEMPHNYSFNSKSFYRGLGTNRLVSPSDPLTNPAWKTSTDTWSMFDYSVQHKKYGGEVGVSFRSPYYFTVGVERREQEGTRPYSVRENIEVPNPISYETDNLTLQGGYRGKNISAAISGFISSFSNDNKFLYWEDPNPSGNNAANIPQNAVLDPDSDYTKLAADFSWRGLPLNSALAVTASYANLDNSFSASEINVNAATIGADFNNLNQTTFDGDIDYTAFSIAVASMPAAKLNTKLYYRYLDKDNKSSHIFYNANQGDNAKELLSYEKNSVGIELGYRLPYRTKVGVDYEYMKIDRSTPMPAYTNDATTFYRYDNPESTKGNTILVKVRNSSLDWLTARLRYKYLKRDSDYTAVYDPSMYVTRFDGADKKMDEWKLGLEVYPVDRLEFGLDFIYRNNDYDYNRDSRNDEKRLGSYLDLTWHAMRQATLSAFVGYENVETDANRITNLQISPVYAQKIDDDYWTYGIALNAPEVVARLSFNISWQYQKSNGAVEYDNGITGTSLVNIAESDDYTKRTLEAEAIYAFDPKLSVILGYLYEKFEYSDIAFTNYMYILGTDYYSGAYYDQNYKANLGYLMVRYGF